MSRLQPIEWNLPVPKTDNLTLPRGQGGGRQSLWDSDLASLCSKVEKTGKNIAFLLPRSTVLMKKKGEGTRLAMWREAIREAGYRVTMTAENVEGPAGKNAKGARLVRVFIAPVK